METIDWSYISALLSIAFGWFLNELGNLLRNRTGDRKTKKKVLFSLLDVYISFRKVDTSDETKILQEKLFKEVPKHFQTKEMIDFFSEQYPNIMNTIIEEKVSKDLDKKHLVYNQAITELSTIDPITAHRLRGKSGILRAFDVINDLGNHLSKIYPAEKPEIERELKSTTEKIKPKIIKEAIDLLEVELKKLSFSISFIMWVKVIYMLRNVKKKAKNDQERITAEMVKKIIERLEKGFK